MKKKPLLDSIPPSETLNNPVSRPLLENKELIQVIEKYHEYEKNRRESFKPITVGMWEDLIQEVEELQAIIDRSKLD
jgi:hypothetical protein